MRTITKNVHVEVEVEVEAHDFTVNEISTLVSLNDLSQVVKLSAKEASKADLLKTASLCLEALANKSGVTFMESEFYRNLNEKLQNAR